jgi:hypothetical protein
VADNSPAAQRLQQQALVKIANGDRSDDCHIIIYIKENEKDQLYGDNLRMAFPVRDPQGSGFKSDMRISFCPVWGHFAHFGFQNLRILLIKKSNGCAVSVL